VVVAYQALSERPLLSTIYEGNDIHRV
jgi:hypothetical protein